MAQKKVGGNEKYENMENVKNVEKIKTAEENDIKIKAEKITTTKSEGNSQDATRLARQCFLHSFAASWMPEGRVHIHTHTYMQVKTRHQPSTRPTDDQATDCQASELVSVQAPGRRVPAVGDF